jgi:phosphoesterase RecJ-like protein
VIDPDAAASGVLVRRLIDRMQLPLNRDAAVCLYTALVCDTGRFQYQSTTAEVFGFARELAEFDLPIPELSRALFEEHRFAYLQLLADVLSNAVLITDKQFVWTKVTQSDLARHGVTFEEVEGLIDVVRRTREAEVSCVLKEAPDGTWRISLRSLGSVDVRLIAEAHGGGGHRFAAGFTSDEQPDVIVNKILGAL